VTATSEIVYVAKCVKRKNDPPKSRREKALATRRRMLRAARDLFCERGYTGTTMELVAERAGVAVQTLYFTFHSKSAILEEAVGASIMGFERWDPRVEAAVNEGPRKALAEHHPWFPKFMEAETQTAALTVVVQASLEIFERVAPLIVVQSSAAASDPQVKAAAELGERRRVEAFALVAELIAKRGKLRRGVSTRRATDVMLTLLSAETYQHLSVRCGWSASDCRKWLVEVLTQQLLPGNPHATRR
jgi:AcrR family transcriptional regulator